MKHNYKLIMPQIEADILSAEDAIKRKGRMSCLTILKDQLEVLGLDQSLSVKEKV